ncbi:tRNA pseudouridine(55) synthase TruB [Planctomyces sp. SH-PL62]|uniref:tRNA pseudouridine(55) synthase TruB n=1 Tax=Planctomyces sp. SH-PL62 TaxID=1636152 RepID=UPI00078C0728|nr:tRNA pseudouridine(55) synthase TruB [Planctomyces sp. SH-PL62]AMV39997.1 tRNA pseudouridine synthase B [Planctomyces sp. SH-PL62]
MSVEIVSVKPEWEGILNVDKPPGLTSRDVVNRVGRLLPKRVKAGHAGTLDPLATGVLVVCIGPATRLIEYVQRMGKTYRSTFRLGARSDTHDVDGTVVATVDPQVPTLAEIEEALASQIGEILQQPPEYSALKVAGRRAYDLARAGEVVELAPRPVHVGRIQILGYDWPRLEVEIDCGSGTYIRSIARDVGEALGCGALMETLVRTRIGVFAQEEAVAPDDLDRDSFADALRPALDAVPDLPRIALDEGQTADVLLGRRVVAEAPAGSQVALVAPDGRLLALGEAGPEGLWIQPRKVLG